MVGFLSLITSLIRFSACEHWEEGNSMGEGVRSWGARAYYTGLTFCGFRVQIDRFNHLSSLQAAKMCVVPPGHMSSLASVPEFFPCVFCFFLFVFVGFGVFCVCVNWLSSLNCQKTFYGGDGPFFPGVFFWWLRGLMRWMRVQLSTGVGNCMCLPPSEFNKLLY